MATAKEISDTARIRAMSAYRDSLDPGCTPGLLREKYGVGYTRIRTLIATGKRLCNAKHHWTYGSLVKGERADLLPLKDWLTDIAEGR